MKKVAVIPAVVLAALCTFTGCKKEEVEKVIAPLVSDGQTTESTEEAQEEKDPLIPEIDTSVEIQAGSRVAVVSKSTSGEFWGLVKKGMEQAIADVNEAYGFKKEDQVTMTFEGASDEKDVESQVNTLDAVLQRIRMYFVFLPAIWIPFRRSWKLPRRMGFRLWHLIPVLRTARWSVHSAVRIIPGWEKSLRID